MAVHIDEVVTEVQEDPNRQRGADAAASAGAQDVLDDPRLALAIDRAVAVGRARCMRLRAD